MEAVLRSLLFIPGNNPGMLLNGSYFGEDYVIFDLEDSVSPSEKDAARFLVLKALKSLDYKKVKKTVRINPVNTSLWRMELEMIIPAKPYAIVIPKTQDQEEILQVEELLANIEKRNDLSAGSIKLIPIIETALGVEMAYAIAKSSSRIEALMLGGEDLTADICAERTKEGKEIYYSRVRIVNAARAAGVQPIDTAFTDTNDDDGLIQDTIFAKSLGFSGKAIISPRHIEHVNRIFTPSEDEIRYAQRVLEAINKAAQEGKGAVSLDGRMIDAPVVERAKRVLRIASIS